MAQVPTKKTLATLLVVGALGAGATLPVLAQDTDLTRPTEREERSHEPKRRGVGERREAFAAALAEELGLPADRVVAALDAVRERMRAERRAAALANLRDRLDEAVAGGDITREQADAILEAYREGVLPFPLVHRRGGPALGHPHVEGFRFRDGSVPFVG